MDCFESALQRTLSQSFQQRLICLQNNIDLPQPTSPYAYVAYERDDQPDSTGAVLFYADTPSELASRAHISRNTIYRILNNETNCKRERLPFVIQKIYLA